MIHPTAIVHPAARLSANVSIGPYSIVGEHVEIGELLYGGRVGLDGDVAGHAPGCAGDLGEVAWIGSGMAVLAG